MKNQYDVVVVGSGFAGCTSALNLADNGCRVCIITSTDEIIGGNSAKAQGGIAYSGDFDSCDQLKKDIIKAGKSQNFTPAVDIIAGQGPHLINKFLLDRLNIPFDRDNSNQFDLTKEAAHSTARILHIKDQTGLGIQKSIAHEIQNHKNITILQQSIAIDILTTNHHSQNCQHIFEACRAFGVQVFSKKNKEVHSILAQHTILATGGLGQLFLHTTNPTESRGDGLAMAYRAGARCVNLHYIQFHPTTLPFNNQRFLLSEALRGEGGILLDAFGRQFMKEIHADADLAPRDIVARSIHRIMIEQKSPHVYLDLRHLGASFLQNRFPAIWQRCMEANFNMGKDLIPVVPAAHYSIGGVWSDLNGCTSVERLYAIGEVACTGVHGANRLASTSLLECLVWGCRVAQHITKIDKSYDYPECKEWKSESSLCDKALVEQDWLVIKNIMWNYVGLNRTHKRLHRAVQMLRRLKSDIEDFYKSCQINNDIIGLRNAVQTALAISLEASKHRKSIGCHYIDNDLDR